jgi:hypothetical protein
VARGAYGTCEWIDPEGPAIECARPDRFVAGCQRGQRAIGSRKRGGVDGLAAGRVQCRDLGPTEPALDGGENLAATWATPSRNARATGSGMRSVIACSLLVVQLPLKFGASAAEP